MSLERFIAEVEQRGLLSERFLSKLRAKLSRSDRPLTAKAVAKFLVDKEHLTQQQATDVLASLLRGGVDVDPAAATETSDVEGMEEALPLAASSPAVIVAREPVAQVPADEADEDGGSSVFEPSLSGIHEEPVPAAEAEELGLAPASDVTTVETVLPAEHEETEEPTAEVELPDLNTKKAPRKSRRRLAREQSVLDEPAESVAADAAAALDAKAKRAKKKKKPAKQTNPWDSPLILVGGGGLALLLIVGATIAWLLNWESGDDKLRLAQEAVNAGSYTQAITHYDEFLERFPRHRDRSLASVRLATVQLRRAVEASNYESALELARTRLKDIESEEKFSEAHGELAALLPRIALGLAKEAEAASNLDDAKNHVEQSAAALGLANNTKYIPKSLRDDAELEQVSVLLARVERRQQSQHDLQQAIAAMEHAIAAGETRAAYTAHVQFARQHPELAGDAALGEMVRKTTAAEQAAIRYVNREQAAETEERPTPWVASLAMAHRRAKPTAAGDAAGKATACIRVDGAVYGLDVASGRLLWRRHVGHARSAWPVPVERDVLVADTVRHELMRLDAETGRLLWRQTLGEPFVQPLVVGKRGLVAAESGRLYVLDLETGARTGYLQFAQPLRVTPAVDRSGERLYIAGDHSSLYTISLADLSCLGVYYLGHAEGSVTVSPAAVMNKLAVLENDGVATSRLRLLSLGDQGAVASQTVERRVSGLATSAPFVAGRRLVVITNRGQIDVYEIGSGEGDQALTLVATRAATGSQPLVRHAALADRNVWLGDKQLTKLSILPTGNRLPVESIENDFAGATFDHPLARFGNRLIHSHRPKGRAGVVVAATDTRQGRTLWETDIALPPAGPPVVDPSAKALTAANAEGYVFRFDEAAIRSRVQDQPLAIAEVMPAELPALTTAVDLGDGRAVFCAAGSDRLLLYNPDLGDRPARWIKLESPLACAVTALGDGLVAPLKVGQVFYLSAADGTSLAMPFQPLLQPRTTWDYQPAGVADHGQRRFVLTDGREKIYLVAVTDQPQPHLEAVAEANVGPFPIESSVVVLGDMAMAVGGGSHLVRFRLPSLEPAGELNLSAPVVWGPFRVGEALLLATADEQLVAVSTQGELVWQEPLEHGDLAGPPLAEQDGVLLAYRKGILERRSLSDGKSLAETDVEHPLAAGPVRFLQRLVLAAHDGTLLVVEAP